MSDYERVLFEIPIYSMTRKSFDDKYEKFIERQIGSFSEEKETVHLIRSFYFPMGVWQFNQITGYIQIVSTDCCFKFLFWNGNKKRYGMETKSRPMISCLDQRYIGYNDGKSNGEFQKLFKARIMRFYKDFQIQRRYIDTAAFDNIAPYIDFVKIIEVARKTFEPGEHKEQ